MVASLHAFFHDGDRGPRARQRAAEPRADRAGPDHGDVHEDGRSSRPATGAGLLQHLPRALAGASLSTRLHIQYVTFSDLFNARAAIIRFRPFTFDRRAKPRWLTRISL